MHLQTMRRRTVAAAIAAVTSIPLHALVPNGAMAGVSNDAAANPAGTAASPRENPRALTLAENDASASAKIGGWLR